MEILSEHMCQGWLEGYLLTGRHGFFSCYEAFIHIVDSMFNQHAKWLKVVAADPVAAAHRLARTTCSRRTSGGRTTTGSATRIPASSTTWSTRRPTSIRVYLPPDANTLLSVTDHCLRSRHYVNVIVAGKQPEPQWLDMDAAVKHCTAGIGIWEWASNDRGSEPDVVMACAGDVPTLETLAAVDLLRRQFPDLKVRVINVVDLMTLQPASEHPHGLERQGLRRPLHDRQAHHLRLPRLPVADPSPDLSPDEPRRTCTCAATRRKGRRRRRSTWPC